MNAFAQYFVRAMSRKMMICGLLMSVLFFGSIQQNSINENASIERDRVETSPYSMIEECESADTGDFPGRALIQRLSDGGSWVTSNRLVGKAMDEALTGKDTWKNVRVIALCK